MTKQAGKMGLTVESKFIEYCGWTPSTTHDNIHKDIDAWTFDGISVSIKYQPACLRTGNIALETELIDPKTKEEVSSWFIRGEAQHYAFIIGDSSYECDAQSLKSFVTKHNKLNKFRTTCLTAKDVISSNHGRKYSQSRCTLVPLVLLLKNKIFTQYKLDIK